ncbi:MAG TPA: 3-hydroxyacyl-CoA dehydrogenase NAD-binding domain-containing protein [Baekduia sp.]|uniref:3-hydroxyacyl-CoA dehydrogenase n=1 Tax=Baekduia sp. TaxID=2600305 RepID=UPI002D7685F0|nr:3-hydroxyacyl-CoA dehydrogenase NAD-binding domain-containing protein [Baekduia sp.]HET6505347.1 3-hydroxyacyl-CoA dehydrogenase NAD-binding domain-containing protein [Baekduia sp.]
MSRGERVGVAGAGTMGAGIAALACARGFTTVLRDPDETALGRARQRHAASLRRAVERGTLSGDDERQALARLELTVEPEPLADCSLIVEAAPERAELKARILAELAAVAPRAVVASNTSSISIAALAADADPERVLGLHFFNPPAAMPLVELVSTARTTRVAAQRARRFAEALGKTVVEVADGPGFLVNRCARPFYLEALRIVEDGQADPAAVDRACCEAGGFAMGPFELMDVVGVDIGLAATESMWRQAHGEPRWRPSPLQVRMVADGRLGAKSEAGGFYPPGETWRDAAGGGEALLDQEGIVLRIVAQLVNEAHFAVADGVAAPRDVDQALELGLRHPRGPFAWQALHGAGRIVAVLDALWDAEHDPRYRVAPGLRRARAA